MKPTRYQTDDAQRRLNEIADTIDFNYHLVQLTPQVAEDIRMLTARRIWLEETYNTRSAPSTIPTVADWARKKRAEALGDETAWGDSQ
jgi:hypothetical protein